MHTRSSVLLLLLPFMANCGTATDPCDACGVGTVCIDQRCVLDDERRFDAASGMDLDASVSPAPDAASTADSDAGLAARDDAGPSAANDASVPPGPTDAGLVAGDDAGSSAAVDAGATPRPVDVLDWSELEFRAVGSGFDFPNPSGNTAQISMLPGTTVAIRFNTITVGTDELYGALKNPEAAGAGQRRLISISTVPGQFEGLPLRCQSVAVSSGQVLFDIDNSRPELTSVCRLDRGTTGETYYFNVRFDDGCGGGERCYTRVTAQ